MANNAVFKVRRGRNRGTPGRSLKTQQYAARAEARASPARAHANTRTRSGLVDMLGTPAARGGQDPRIRPPDDRRTRRGAGWCRGHLPAARRRDLELPRKEVIQPHLPVRLPCYDFTPITSPTFDGSLPRVGSPASGVARFRGVTGGVYKTRERIHPDVADSGLLATPPSWRRVSASNPNRDRLFGIRSTSRYRSPLYRPM